MLPDTDAIVLAFEGGATHTRAGVVHKGALLAVAEGGPCNPTAYGLAASLRGLVEAGEAALAAYKGARPTVAAVGSAGAVDAAQKRGLGTAICRHFGLARAVVGTDLHPLLLANAWDGPGILAIAGTGSNVLARGADGRLVQVGGRGTLLGDEGSGYMIAAEALRRAARAVDGWGAATRLAEALPRAAGVANVDALIGWGALASKRDIAALCAAVFEAAGAGDVAARECIEHQAALLADQVLAAARQVGEGGAALHNVFGVGGLFERYPLFTAVFNARLADAGMHYTPPPVTGPVAVAVLARLASVPAWAEEVRAGAAADLPGTEALPDTPPLDGLSPRELVDVMFSAERRVGECLARNAGPVAAVVEAAVQALRAGGRMLYAGAGTSGRLGVLDAAECGPTFGVGEEVIRAIIAGGENALREAVEGAEDDAEAGAAAIAGAGVDERDLLIGIAASGRTPFVAGALAEAARRGARTALVACVAEPGLRADLVVSLDTGPEALPGSTRLKAGTATKIVLNAISTGAMALSGRVYEGRMVAMRPSNTKLRARAVRMTAELAACDAVRAEAALVASDWDIRAALLMLLAHLDAASARARLAAASGNLRQALKHS